jgi:hypothetical protein
MCASPLSPRHAQDWMGGGLVSRQMMHASPSAVISAWLLDRPGRRRTGPVFKVQASPVYTLVPWSLVLGPAMAARKVAGNHTCVPSHTGGMASSFSGLGAARGWRRSGRFIGPAFATMLIVRVANCQWISEGLNGRLLLPVAS